jgi:DNA-binding MarR family transcriptional regulator
MTKIVARLEERELVQRTPHPTDRRQVILSATPAGRDMLAQFERAREEWLARRVAELTIDEREVLRQAAEILRRVAEA